MDSSELKAQIDVRSREIDRLRHLNSIDESELRYRESKAAISAHKITKALVFTTDGDDKPWFNHVKNYAEWIAKQPTLLPWAEWNGMVYQSRDLIAGHMPESAIRYEDIP